MNRSRFLMCVMFALSVSWVTYANTESDDRFYELFEMSDLIQCSDRTCVLYRTGAIVERYNGLPIGSTVIFTEQGYDYAKPTPAEIRKYSKQLANEWVLLIEYDRMFADEEVE